MGFFSQFAAIQASQINSQTISQAKTVASPTLIDKNQIVSTNKKNLHEVAENNVTYSGITFRDNFTDYTPGNVSGFKCTPVQTIVGVFTFGSGNISRITTIVTYYTTSSRTNTTRTKTINSITFEYVSSNNYWIYPTLTNYYVSKKTSNTMIIVADVVFATTAIVFMFLSFLCECTIYQCSCSRNCCTHKSLPSNPPSHAQERRDSSESSDNPAEIERKAVEKESQNQSTTNSSLPLENIQSPPPSPYIYQSTDQNPYANSVADPYSSVQNPYSSPEVVSPPYIQQSDVKE